MTHLAKMAWSPPEQMASTFYGQQVVVYTPSKAPAAAEGYYTSGEDIVFDLSGATNQILDPTQCSLVFRVKVSSTLANPARYARHGNIPAVNAGLPFSASHTSINGGTIDVSNIRSAFARFHMAKLLCTGEQAVFESTVNDAVLNASVATQPQSQTRISPSYMSVGKLASCGFAGYGARVAAARTTGLRRPDSDDPMNVDPGGFLYEVPLSHLSALFDTNQLIPLSLLAQSSGTSACRLALTVAQSEKCTVVPVPLGNPGTYRVEIYQPRVFCRFLLNKDPALEEMMLAMYEQRPVKVPSSGKEVMPGRLVIPFRNQYTYTQPVAANATSISAVFNIAEKSVLGMLMRFRDDTIYANSTEEINVVDVPQKIASFSIRLGSSETIPLTAVRSNTDDGADCQPAFMNLYRAARHIFAPDAEYSHEGHGLMHQFLTLPAGHVSPHASVPTWGIDTQRPFLIAVSLENLAQSAADLGLGETHTRGLNTFLTSGQITVDIQLATAHNAAITMETMIVYQDALLVQKGALGSVRNETLN